MDLERGRTDMDGMLTRLQRVEGGVSDLTRRMDLIQQNDEARRRERDMQEKHLEDRLTWLEQRMAEKVNGLLERVESIADDIKDGQKANSTFMRQVALISISTAVGVAVSIVTFFVKGGFNGVG